MKYIGNSKEIQYTCLDYMSLPVVLQLLQREDVFVEIFLKFLIGIINVELFKAVDLQST